MGVVRGRTRLQAQWHVSRALAVAGFALLCGGHSHADVPNTFIDPSDGQFDMSRYLLENKGVLPVPVIITEPALGYGGGLFGLFFDQPLGEALKTSLGETGKAIPPNITGLGASRRPMAAGVPAPATTTPGSATPGATWAASSAATWCSISMAASAAPTSTNWTAAASSSSCCGASTAPTSSSAHVTHG